MDKKGGGVCGFLCSAKNNRIINGILYFAVAPLFMACLFFVIYAVAGVYPFSDKHISAYDMNAQIAPVIEHLFDVLEGKAPLFYSYSVAGGADTFGTMAYCLISPFTFVFLLFGKGNAVYGTSVVLPLKAACICVSALYYLKKRFDMPAVAACALALCYCCSGYFFVANTYINWLDLLIWLPLFALGFYKITQKKSCKLFVFSLTAMIWTSFSITCFSLFIIFPIGLAYIFLVYEGDKKTLAFDYCSALAGAVALSLPILVPAFISVMNSQRTGGMFDNLFNAASANHLYSKFSYIFTDGATLAFTIIYFIDKGFRDKRARFLAFSAILVFAPVISDECCNLLNFGSYMSYSLRFGFLNSFFFFYCTALYLSEHFNKVCRESAVKRERFDCAEEAEAPLYVRKREVRPVNAAFACTCGIIAAVALCGWTVLLVALNNKKYSPNFFGVFAHSVGGLEVVVLLFSAFAVLFSVCFVWGKSKKLSMKPFAAAVCVLVAGQCVFTQYSLVKGNESNPATLTWFKEAAEYCVGESGEKVRLKTDGDYLSADSPITLRTSSFGVFSSVIDKNNFSATGFFGYSGNDKNVVRSYGGTYFSDCLLGYEYLITSGNAAVGWHKKAGYTPVNDDFALYVNPLAFPRAFVCAGGEISENFTDEQSDYNSLLTFLGGDETLCYGVSESDVISQGDGVWRVRTSESENASIYLKCNVPEEYSVAYCKYEWSKTKAEPLNAGDVIRLAGNAAGRQSYSLYIKVDGAEALDKKTIAGWFETFVITRENIEKTSALANLNACDISYGLNKMHVRAQAIEGECLFVSFVAIDGHTVKVNGKDVELKKNFLDLIIIPLNKGENEVTITYNSPYVRYGAAGCIAGALILLVLFLLKRLSVGVRKKLSSIVAVAALGLAGGIICFFFVFPLVLCLRNSAVAVFNALF